MTQVLAKKNYTDHVPTPDEEVDGLDFGSGHLAYQQRGGNARPSIFTVRHRECYRQEQCTGNKEKLDAAEIQSVNFLAPPENGFRYRYSLPLPIPSSL